MAKLVPQATVDALRSFNNISVDNYGITCQLFIPNNTTQNEPTDVYKVPSDTNFFVTKTKVYVEWTPNMYRLRKLGVFAEGEIPIICWFKNEPEIALGSYIKLDTQYVPAQYDRDEFEITDIIIRGIYDAIVLKAYKLVPRRVKTNLPQK